MAGRDDAMNASACKPHQLLMKALLKERAALVASASRAAETTSLSLKRGAPLRVYPMATLSFGPITDKNVEMLRKINLQIFPVRYNDTFYGDVLFTPRGYTKFAYWDGYIVGAICCRLESQDDRPHVQRAYIMTLGVLAPYRQFQIGSALVLSMIKHAVADNIDDIYLHVQTSNDVALRFYRSFGFEITETIRDYYKRIDPPDCYVLVKKLSTKATSFP